MAVEPMDRAVGKKLIRKGCYNQAELDRYLALITPQSKVLVVGAHIGGIGIALATHCQAVTMIEANPDTFELLSLNVRLNDLQNCTLHNFAASNESGEINFLLSKENSGGSKREPLVKKYQFYYDKPKQAKVQAHRLDDVLHDQEFDLIIMDIEGSEYFALQGMPKLLAAAKQLVMEFMPDHLRYVSRVSVNELLSKMPAYSKMTVPSKQMIVSHENIASTLQQMLDNNDVEDGLIFSR